MKEDKLDLLEYEALTKFLARIKDERILAEVVGDYTPYGIERLRTALSKILDALPLPTRDEKLEMESFALIERLIHHQLDIERCNGKYNDVWWKIEFIKKRAHIRYERRLERQREGLTARSLTTR